MELPPTDEQGRFLPQLRTASIFSRYFAKAVDFVVAGALTVILSLLFSFPPAALGASAWLMLTDWAGSPGKWLFRIRAVTLEGKPLGPVASLQRNLVLGLPLASYGLLVSGFIGLQGEDRKWDAGTLLCVGLVVVLGEFIGMVMQPESRRWGDVFARSRVIDR